MKLLPCLVLCAATTPAWGQVVDTNFTDLSSTTDVDLCLVREQAYGAAGIDLSAYGLPGVHDYVQSIYVRVAHDGNVFDQHGVRGRLIFPPSVSVLGVISDATQLGGASDDGLLTQSDADFGIVTVAPDRYSASLRGVEGDVHAEHVCPRPGGAVEFYLLPRANDLDDFRVLIDYGASFATGVSFDVELWYDDGTEDFAHVRGVQVGDPLGGVLASGDFGEVNGIQGIPLTSGLLPPTTDGRKLDMSSGILIRRNGGAIGSNHLELYDPTTRALATHARRNAYGKMTRGLHGKVYAADLNLPGFVVIDLEGGGIGAVPVAGSPVPQYVAGSEGSNELVLASQDGAASAVDVAVVDIPSATLQVAHTVTAGDLIGLRGVAVAGGMIHLLSVGGEYVRMDPVTGAYTVTVLASGVDAYLDLDVDAAGTTLYLLRSGVVNKDAVIDTIDVASGVASYAEVIDTDLRHAQGLTRDAGGLVWIMNRGFAELEMAKIAAYDPATWLRAHLDDCAPNPESHHMLSDVNPDPLGVRYCSPAVSNAELGRPGWITAFGSKAVVDNDFHLAAFGVTSQQFGLFLNAPAAGFVPNPAGSNGNLCLGGAIGRFPVSNTGVYRSARVQVDLNAQPRPAGPTPVAAGETWYYQFWYREGAGGSNFTDAIAVTFE